MYRFKVNSFNFENAKILFTHLFLSNFICYVSMFLCFYGKIFVIANV